jgi:phage gp45-like
MTGTVTGHKIGKNNDGDKLVVLLQVQISDEDDIQTVELFTQAGDEGIPPVGTEVIIVSPTKNRKIAIAASDLIEPEDGAGNREIYSQSGGAKKARIKLNSGGLILFANDVEDLKALMTQMITEIKAIITTGSPTTQTISAASQTKFDTLQSRFDTLLEAP